MKKINLLLCALLLSAFHFSLSTMAAATNVVVSSSATLTGLTTRVQGLENTLGGSSNLWNSVTSKTDTNTTAHLADDIAGLTTWVQAKADTNALNAFSNSITAGTITVNGVPLAQLGGGGVPTNFVTGGVTNLFGTAAGYAAAAFAPAFSGLPASIITNAPWLTAVPSLPWSIITNPPTTIATSTVAQTALAGWPTLWPMSAISNANWTTLAGVSNTLAYYPNLGAKIITNNAVVLTGAGSTQANGTWVYRDSDSSYHYYTNATLTSYAMRRLINNLGWCDIFTSWSFPTLLYRANGGFPSNWTVQAGTSPAPTGMWHIVTNTVGNLANSQIELSGSVVIVAGNLATVSNNANTVAAGLLALQSCVTYAPQNSGDFTLTIDAARTARVANVELTAGITADTQCLLSLPSLGASAGDEYFFRVHMVQSTIYTTNITDHSDTYICTSGDARFAGNYKQSGEATFTNENGLASLGLGGEGGGVYLNGPYGGRLFFDGSLVDMPQYTFGDGSVGTYVFTRGGGEAAVNHEGGFSWGDSPTFTISAPSSWWVISDGTTTKYIGDGFENPTGTAGFNQTFHVAMDTFTIVVSGLANNSGSYLYDMENNDGYYYFDGDGGGRIDSSGNIQMDINGWIVAYIGAGQTGTLTAVNTTWLWGGGMGSDGEYPWNAENSRYQRSDGYYISGSNIYDSTDTFVENIASSYIPDQTGGSSTYQPLGTDPAPFMFDPNYVGGGVSFALMPNETNITSQTFNYTLRLPDNTWATSGILTGVYTQHNSYMSVSLSGAGVGAVDGVYTQAGASWASFSVAKDDLVVRRTDSTSLYIEWGGGHYYLIPYKAFADPWIALPDDTAWQTYYGEDTPFPTATAQILDAPQYFNSVFVPNSTNETVSFRLRWTGDRWIMCDVQRGLQRIGP